MSLETLFTVCNYGVLPAWAMLVLAPGWSWTTRLVHAVWIPLVLGSVYLAVTAANVPFEAGSFFSLAGVVALFSIPEAALIGWIHYLAFDLFVGAWEARDARRRGIAHRFVVPCLVLTLFVGPIGLLLYLVLRLVLCGETGLEETAVPADPC